MSESPEKKKRSRLGMVAGAAMLSGLSAMQAPEAQSAEIMSTSELKQFHEIERNVLENKISLKEQLLFLERSLSKGSRYARELDDIRLTEQRLSQIYKVTNEVSSRLTMKYAEAPDDPELREYFSDVDMLRNATSTFKVTRASGESVCNKFAVQDGGDVFEMTAFHCVVGSTVEKDFYHPERTEIAVKFMTKEEWEKHTGKKSNQLPKVDAAATTTVSAGRVVTTFSYGRNGEEKIDFSVALPSPANKNFLFAKKDLAAFAEIGMTDMIIFFKPYREAETDPLTRRTKSIGSSGGPVYAHGSGIMGPFSATKQIQDTSGKMSLPIGFASPPEASQKGIRGARALHQR